MSELQCDGGVCIIKLLLVYGSVCKKSMVFFYFLLFWQTISLIRNNMVTLLKNFILLYYILLYICFNFLCLFCFLNQVDKILKVIPRERRTFLFSATMTKKVDVSLFCSVLLVFWGCLFVWKANKKKSHSRYFSLINRSRNSREQP